MSRGDDATGYLELICDHLVENFERYPEDPNKLRIINTVPGDEQGLFATSSYGTSDYLFVALSCCFTGDWAVIHAPTSNVVAFYAGSL